MTQYVLKYSGSARMKAGTIYNGGDFTLGNVMQMKTKKVSVAISGLTAFPITFDDLAYVDTTATYTFDIDCIIAFGTMVEVI